MAIAAINTLSRLDLVGVLEYGWGGGQANWVYQFKPAGDKTEAIAAIKRMQMGDMPDFGTPMTTAYNALKNCDAGQKHIIIISDGDPAPPPVSLIKNMQSSKITCTGVVVFPHGGTDQKTLQWIAYQTGGRFYNVKDPNTLPQIFIKEAQVVRRSLIIEQPFVPKITNWLSETVRGLDTTLPKLDGFVLTGPKGGLTQLVMATDKGDPVLATGQMKLGRSVAFTSGAGARWAKDWVGGWGGYERFWEQVVRWAAKPSQAADCEIFADVEGRQVSITVDAVDAEGNFVQFADLVGQVVAPEMSVKELALTQIGPGRYRAGFQAGRSGSYLVNLRYRKAGAEGKTGMVQSVVTVPYAPEFRDLTDNTPLLAAVQQATGGRQLGPDPEKANLFEREGVSFPHTALPLTKHLFTGGARAVDGQVGRADGRQAVRPGGRRGAAAAGSRAKAARAGKTRRTARRGAQAGRARNRRPPPEAASGQTRGQAANERRHRPLRLRRYSDARGACRRRTALP
ncbi:MAG: hypothetical protein AMJ81_11415 [Phycisphaerae bacterium SM23_33]|nr:MAG: hypothetical protein AMJ81_11415 [Phycisphaerae bacterium SM23_33]